MQGEEELIIAGKNEAHLYKAGGNTRDIISAIAEADKVSIGYVEQFAHTLESEDIAETCANIWDWVRSTIPYKEDGTGVQKVQLPGQLYNNRHAYLGGTGEGGDCKSMSLMCSSILRSLGNYNFNYRFISENRDENFHHVYLVVDYIDESEDKVYIPLDCTLSEFGVEVPFAKKTDKAPSGAAAHVGEFNFFKIGKSSRISGMQEDIAGWRFGQPYPANWHARILSQLGPDYAYPLTDIRHWAIYNAPEQTTPPTQTEVITNWIYGSPYPVGWTPRLSLGLGPDYTYLINDIRHWAVYNDPGEAQTLYEKGAPTSYWELETADLKGKLPLRIAALKKMMQLDFVEKYGKHGMPIQFSESVNQLNKHFDDLLTFGSNLIYHYWNDTNFVSYGACRGEGATSFPPVPFPDRLAGKRNAGNAFWLGMKTWGVAEKNIRELANLGTFFKYGISLDYMLYRCKCIELYGQPFAPRPGVPYYDAANDRFINQGTDSASLAATIAIAMCCPSQGGVGRPFGEPYWSIGGHILPNGANEATVETFRRKNPKPGTWLNASEQVPGRIANNGNGITLEEQVNNMVVYNAWCMGNYVMLPQPPPGPSSGISGYPAIGYGTGEIITIVVAVVTVCIAIATFIAKMVAQFTQPANKDTVSIPTIDFTWDYQTSDGCMIGHPLNPAEHPGVSTVKMCNGKIVETNPNMNDPANQPPDPGNFFAGAGGKKKLLIGGGILMLGGGALMLSAPNSN